MADEKMKTSAGKLKGNNRCTMRRARNIELNDSITLEKSSIQKNAVKSYFLAKAFVRKPHAEEIARTLYRKYIMNGIPDEDIPEEILEEVRNLRRILRLYDDNLGRWNPNEIFGLIKDVYATPTGNDELLKEFPVLQNYIEKKFRQVGDITELTCKLQAKKAYDKVRRYCGSEGRIPVVASEQKVFDMFDIIDVEDKPDLIFYENDGKSIEAVKLCTRKPDVTQTGKRKDKSALQSMELYSKFTYARSLINDEEAHDIKGSYYFLGRKDDKSTGEKKHFEPYFFEERGGNIVSLSATVYSEETEKKLKKEKIIIPDGLQNPFSKIFKPQFEEYKEGEVCEKEACEHCEFESICSYSKAPQCSIEEKAKKSVRDIKLSAQQEAAVNFRKGVGRINAVAGAGKTLVVALRTAFMLSEGIDPEEILLITFTNAGAAEMKERIEMYDEDLMTDSDMTKLTCTTFNSFGDQIIKREYEKFGFTNEPRLIDEIERKELITELLNIQPIKELNYENFNLGRVGALPVTEIAFREIKKNRFSQYDQEEFEKIMIENLFIKDKHKYHEACKKLLRLYEVYDQTLKERNLIEFQDQEALLFDLLDMEPYYFEDNFDLKHIIIDEFQDSATCSPTSL